MTEECYRREEIAFKSRAAFLASEGDSEGEQSRMEKRGRLAQTGKKEL